uniref:Uncharacterized protein n=1 Tax=Rhizophora mucronata TaxID=61149 RepID=A0A2P2NYT5_RHIMU
MEKHVIRISQGLAVTVVEGFEVDWLFK